MASFDIEAFVGPCFVFICLSLILYGLVIAQIYYYFTTYRDDVYHRLLVLSLCVLETVHSIACNHIMYTLAIRGFADIKNLAEIPWSAGVAVYLEALISTFVHLFYTQRIWRLCRDLRVLFYLLTVFCTRVAVAFRSNAFICTEGTWASLAASKLYMRIADAAFCLSVLADLSVTAMVLYSLLRSRFKAHSRNTKYLLRKLIMQYALSSGVLTAMASIVTLILFNIFPSDLHYGGTLMFLTKVYGNSMMAMLNRRQGIKDEVAHNDGLSVHLSNLPRGTNGTRPTATRIQVVRDTVTASDTWFAEEASKTRSLEPVLCEELPHAPEISKC